MKLKKILSLTLALMLLSSSLALASCKSTEDEPKESESNSADQQPPADNGAEDDGKGDGEGDGEDDGNEEPTDPADIVDPNAPKNVDLEIIKDGASDYIIVYDSDAEGYEQLAQTLSEYINSQFGAELPVYPDTTVSSSPNYTNRKKIIIGDADSNAAFVKKKLYETNDFAVDVCGSDLVIYAVNEYVRDYMFEIAKNEFFKNSEEQTSLTVPKDGGFIYHKSKYKSQNFAQYQRDMNGGFTLETLLDVFEARSFTAQDGTVLPYRLYIPSNYDEKGGTTPVMIFLHGAGERGNDNRNQLKNFMPNAFSQKNSAYANAIIIAPQCPKNNQWVDTPWAEGNYSISSVAESNELASVVELLSQIEEEYKPDTSRRYAVGLSMGGFGTWDLAMRHTELFAAVMPLCGGADPTQAENLKELPIWTMHGDKDGTVPYAGTAAMAEAFKAINAKNFNFSPMPGAGHSIWVEVGNNSSYGRWLFGNVKATENG